MSLTLGLNTALSGLLTSQRALDVISQNVVNVNTPGYTRKVMSPESRVVNGVGAGVQEGAVLRSVDEGLVSDIRRQASQLEGLKSLQDYYPRIEDLFGKVGDTSSVAHIVQTLQNSFEVLATEADKPAQQWSTIQAAVQLSGNLQQSSTTLQNLRLEADRAVADTVTQINEQLTNIADLNQKIVRNTTIGLDAEDLKDKRDTALTTLAGLMDISYYERSDGSMLVYTGQGRTLVDNTASSLSHAATTTTDASLSLAGGNFNTITLTNFTDDLGATVQGGKLKTLLNLRDTIIPNLQANLDELSSQLKDGINQVHNRGTTLPQPMQTYNGTRVFALQGDVVQAATDAAPTIYYNGGTTIAAAAFGSLTFNNADATQPYLATITCATAGALAGLTAGTTFSINGSTNSRNDGTYKVVSVNGDTLTVQKANTRQTIKLGGSDDVMIGVFDTTGNQIVQGDLRTIMQTDYSGSWTVADTKRGKDDYEAKSSAGPWSINEVSAHLQQYLIAQGYSSATVGLNSAGKLDISLGSSAITGSTTDSLVFRDQASSTAGADQSDATINFDVDGDGTTDQTVKGFANFFGLNDFFVSNHEHGITDSDPMAANFKTSQARVIRLLDATGQIGNQISINAGSSLSDIATAINAATRTNESVLLASPNFTTTTATTFTVSDPTGTVLVNKTIAAGNLSLAQIAGTLTSGSVTAQVVKEDTGYRLRLFDSSGKALTVDVAGGTISGTTTTLGSTLTMAQTQRVNATVIPEGSGYRLRIKDSQDRELFIGANQDALGTSLLTDLGLHPAATRMASFMNVRADIQTAPTKISRGAMQWNADLGQYYLSQGDNTVAQQMADAMNAKVSMRTAGSIYSGQYTFSEYASATISMVAADSDHSKQQIDYQTTLKQALDFQYTSQSGVNLDEEVSNMISFQQSYSAAAKVISTLQQMLEELVNIVR
ncbi:MAG: flagellar hook-associated protein FlgK [Actinomycetota bacterium]